MLRIRLVEEAIAREYPQQEMRCPTHLSIGQEAAAVGVCHALRATDKVFGTHRSHAHYLAKGGNLQRMLAEIFGKVTGCSQGRGGSMHLVDQAVGFMGSVPIVASTIPIATGAAFSAQLKGDGTIAAAFFGDAATEEGVFYESMNFAALKKLPMLFVCENNFYSVYSPLSVRQPEARNLVHIAESMGVKGMQADGNDIEMVHALTRDSINALRRGAGPILLLLDTYRWREHCGPNYDNAIGYRSESEFLAWKAKCPLERYASVLQARGAIDDSAIAVMTQEIHHEIEVAFTYARASDFPAAATLNHYVYCASSSTDS